MNNNKYSGLLETAFGMDMYNLALGVTPPAQISLDPTSNLSATLFTGRLLAPRLSSNVSSIAHTGDVALFNRQDQLFLKSLRVDCNLADGMVDALASHSFNKGLVASLYLDRIGPAVRGLITTVAGTSAVSGDASARFTEDLAPGQSIMWLDNNGALRRHYVNTITANNALTLAVVTESTGMFAGSTTARPVHALVEAHGQGGAYTIQLSGLAATSDLSVFIGNYAKILPIRGTVTAPAGVVAKITTFVGKNTKFLSDLTVGQYVRYLSDSGFYVTIIVGAILDDAHFTSSPMSVAGAGVPLAITNKCLGAPFVAATTTADAIPSGWVDTYIAMNIEIDSNSIIYDTYSMDPAFAASRLIFNAVAEIVHSFPVAEKIG